MRMNKIMIAAVLSLCGASAVNATTGKIAFNGSIVDAPCSISAESLDQTVDMGAISNLALAKNSNTGESPMRVVKIQLEECTVNEKGTKDGVQVKFSGPESTYDRESFAINGQSGAYIVLTGPDNVKVKNGVATTPIQNFENNSSPVLTFGARIKGGGATSVLTLGSFTSALTFELLYP